VTLEALLTFAGILVAVWAVVRPVQRRSLALFASPWRVGAGILLAFVLIFCRDAPFGLPPPFGWPLPSVLFGLTVGAFIVPVGAALWSWFSWHRAKLSGEKFRRVENIFQAALREREFDEVERIVRRNQKHLDRLAPSAVSVLFHPTMIAAIVGSGSLVHLELLADMRFLRSVDDRFGVVDEVVRELLRSDISPLRSLVVSRYGGLEHLTYTASEQDLVAKTFTKAEWYVDANAHYPLVISAVEALRSGRFDTEYNDIGRSYEADQGISARSHCPIYLAAKTEVIAIEAALEAKFEGDFYVSDLFDIFRAVQERSNFNRAVWEDGRSNSEFPTPYAYLLYEIHGDLWNLSAKALEASTLESGTPIAESPGRIARDLALTWSFCVWNIASSEDQVSPEFRKYTIKQYLLFVLALGWGPSEIYLGSSRGHVAGLDTWRDLFLGQLRDRFRGDASKRTVLREAMEDLDQGKRYVSDGYDWLENELFGNKPTP
jgi:hypothetical protein